MTLELELHEVRQIIYAKLSQGMCVDWIFRIRTFEVKVKDYFKKYRRRISDFQEKTWRDKIIIIEKAIIALDQN